MRWVWRVFVLLILMPVAMVWADEGARVLIEPTGEYAGQMPHYDPLFFNSYERDKLIIYDMRLVENLDKFPDWREIPMGYASSYLERHITVYAKVMMGLEGAQRVDGALWDGNPIDTCARYLPLAVRAFEEVADDSDEGSFCYTRAALRYLGVVEKERTIQNTGFVVTDLEEVFKYLPMKDMFPYRGGAQPEQGNLGLPEGAHMTWPAGSPLGDNAVRIEYMLFPVTDGDMSGYQAQAMRVVDGYLCYPNHPCVCRYSANCEEFVVGMLAAWVDDANATHWLLFAGSRIDFTQGQGWDRRDYSRLYHITQAAGERPKLNKNFDEGLIDFIRTEATKTVGD